jgi:Protein of unknown function (DUF4238)
LPPYNARPFSVERQMDETKNQHYVPQAYLNRSTDDGQRVWVYDMVEGKVFRSHVRNITSLRFFYDMPREIEAQADCPQSHERILRIVREGSYIPGITDSS